jgi:hypothetical protein
MRVSQKESTEMSIVLNSKFATAEDTAKALGVSKTRLKWLLRLVESGRSKGNKTGHKNGARNLTSTRKRKNARGKVKKVAR